ncbi:hypothetical protein [Kordia sp.]|uniref:hypothetical protein n=1 Tax=Kordia sp. TaxID=1965332 RepID=UPI003B5B7032
MRKKYFLPLFLFYIITAFGQQSTVAKQIVEGEIEFISKLPDPATMDYPDCNYTAVLNLKSNSSDVSISIVFKGIENRKKLATANYRAGDKVRVTMIPFEKADAEIRQTQLADGVDDFEMKVYYAVESKKIKRYSKGAKRTLEAKTTKVTSIEIVAKDRKSARIRKKKIKSEIKRIDKLLKSHGGTWTQWEDDIQEFKTEYAKATEAQASKWVGNAFFSAGNAYAEQNEGNFVEAMTSFNTYLKQYNIDLIVIRIPFKGEVSGNLFSDKLSDYVVNPYAMKVTQELLKNDVEVHDILPKLLEEREKHPLLFWYNDFEETHPAEAISWIVARELKELLSRYPEYENIPRIETLIKDTVGIRNGKSYRWPTGNKAFKANKMITFKSVTDTLGKVLDINYDENYSPFLFIGNSFLAFPSIKRGGSIPHYFAYETGFSPDVYYRSGGIGLGRLIYQKGLSFIEKRRALVYIALPQSFQGTVPVIPLSASINEEKYGEKSIIKLDKNTWAKHTAFIPEESEKNILLIQQNGYLRAIGKEVGKSDGGDIIVTLPKTPTFDKNDILKIGFEFRSVGFGTVVVNYNGEEKSFLRSNDSNDDYFETVYFKINKQTNNREFKISFRGIKRKQVIKEINVSLLSSK